MTNERLTKVKGWHWIRWRSIEISIELFFAIAFLLLLELAKALLQKGLAIVGTHCVQTENLLLYAFR